MGRIHHIIAVVAAALAASTPTPASACSYTERAHVDTLFPKLGNGGEVGPGEAITFEVSGVGTFDGATVSNEHGPLDVDLEYYRSTSLDDSALGLGIIRPPPANWPGGVVTVEFAFTAPDELGPNGVLEQSTFEVLTSLTPSDDVFEADTFHDLVWNRTEQPQHEGTEWPCGPPKVLPQYGERLDYRLVPSETYGHTANHLLEATRANGEKELFAIHEGASREVFNSIHPQLFGDTVCVSIRSVTVRGDIGPAAETCDPVFFPVGTQPPDPAENYDGPLGTNEMSEPIPDEAGGCTATSRAPNAPEGLLMLSGLVAQRRRKRKSSERRRREPVASAEGVSQ